MRIGFLKYLAMIFALCLVMSAFVCCTPEADGVPSLDFSDKPFSARVEGSVDGILLSARLDSSAEHTDGEEREYTLTFFEPESLSGLVLRHLSDGSLSARLGDTILPQNYLLDGMLVPAELLLEEWETVSVVKTEKGYEICGECDGGRATFAFGESEFPETVSGEYKERSFNLRVSLVAK